MINIFCDRLFEKREQLSLQDQLVLDFLNIDSSVLDEKALKETTYFTCIKILSDAIGKLPCHLYKSTEQGNELAKKHYLYDLLRLRPNPYMSSVDFFKTCETIRQHYGNCFILIDRKPNGQVRGLYPFRPSRIVVDNQGLLSNKRYKILIFYIGTDGLEHSALYEEVIHLKSFTLDGINGMATRSILTDTIDTNMQSQKYIKNLFNNGLFAKMVVQYAGDLKDKKDLKAIQDKFGALANGVNNAGKIFPIPAGFNVTPLNMSLADAQFEQIKKLSIQQIAAAFGIKMHQLNNLEDTNNNSLEQQQLSFYIDTLLILIQSIEQEFTYKLLTVKERAEGYNIEFNEDVILRTDAKTQAEILSKYVGSGIKTPNEARHKLKLLSKEEGNELILNAGMFKLKDINTIKNTKV